MLIGDIVLLMVDTDVKGWGGDVFPATGLNRDFSLTWCLTITDNVCSLDQRLSKAARQLSGCASSGCPETVFFMLVILAFNRIILHYNSVSVSLIN